MSYGLAPRPQLAPDELAALVAVANELLEKEVARPLEGTPSWRFSGRWFQRGPYSNRRPTR